MVTAVKGKLTDQTQSSVCPNKLTATPEATKAFLFFMLLQKMQFVIKKNSSEQQNAWQNENHFQNSARV